MFYILSHDPYGYENTLFLSKKDDTNYSISLNDEVLSEFFHSNLKIEIIEINEFADSVALFLKNEGKILFSNDLEFINKLFDFDFERTRKYNAKLIKTQNLFAADTAWQNNDYKKFVQIIDKMNIEDLASSYLLKYKIGKRRMK